LISRFVRDGFRRLLDLDPFSVFACAEEVACLDFNYRGQIGSADGPVNSTNEPITAAVVLRFTRFAF
jgi:hypothetical protein